MCTIDLRKCGVGTFHGLAHKFLRIHHDEAELPQDFVIMDSEEQYRLIKKIVKENSIDEKLFPIRSFQNFISSHKDKAIRSDNLEAQDNNLEHEIMSRVYNIYENHTRSENLVDFSELLLKSYEVLKDNITLRDFYKNKFSHILVDEFQDTNPLQYNWLKLLTSDNTKIMAVGDDDQSIYTWRGARIENILEMQKDYPDIKVIRLEQNYRSTKNILDAANSLIKNNTSRWGKSLWTDKPEGEEIVCYEAFNDQAEARYIADQITKKTNNNEFKFNEIGILYRTNAQSRVIEEALMKSGIQYSIYGGLKFFDRAEIKI
jgi:Superfamily I DNA and RNA helicases